jgi:hypothetical protein
MAMVEKVPFNLDAALAALKQDERAALPVASESLQARILADAATVAAEQPGAVAPLPRNPAGNRSRGFGRLGGLRVFDLFDAWSGAAVAAIVLGLAVGLGVGYEAGPEVMDRMGFGDTNVAVAGDQGDGFSMSEGVL